MGYFRGFAVTFRKMFEKRVTTPYPKEKRDKPVRFHGRHVLNRYEDGMEKCIGCELCAGVCPAQCIYVRAADNPLDEPLSPGEPDAVADATPHRPRSHADPVAGA